MKGKHALRIFNFLLFGMLFFAFTFSSSATNINGRFVVMSADSLKLEVLLQINTNTGSDDMGGATIVIGFNTYSLNFNSNPQVNTDYVFHNFNGSNYSPATITRPATDKLWLNIDLPYNNSNSGSVVSGSDGWTDVATLFFDIINTNDTLKLNWLVTNPYWGIYDGNNTTLWNLGTFQNLNYPVNDITSPEIISASLLDSEKLEILFSERLDSSSAINLANYSINNGISVLSGILSTTQNKVTLNTTAHTPGQQYTITVSNVHDIAGNLISLLNNPFTYPDSVNGVEDKDLIPLEFSLQQNYPNPFNPSTKIKVNLKQGTHLRLAVYNMLGELVTEITNAEYSEGIHQFDFDATGLASGIYIYRAESSVFTDTKKMILLR